MNFKIYQVIMINNSKIMLIYGIINYVATKSVFTKKGGKDYEKTDS